VPIFSRWLRLFVLCLLIPAYGIAAAAVSSFAGEASVDGLRVEGHRSERLSPAGGRSASPAEASITAAAACVTAGGMADGNGLLAVDRDDAAALMLEHGDTSDDMSDHCLPHVGFAVAPLEAVETAATAPSRAPDAPPKRLHRPPR